jgi:hypothetical protein
MTVMIGGDKLKKGNSVSIWANSFSVLEKIMPNEY